MAKPGVLEKLRFEEAQSTNERLERIEAKQDEILDLLRQLATAGKPADDVLAKAAKKPAKTED